MLVFTRTGLRRLIRDRTALFFMIVLPVVVILVIGATVGSFSTFRVGVVDLGSGQAGSQLAAALRRAPDLTVRSYATAAGAAKAVARGEANTAVVLPAGMDATLKAGGRVTVELLAEPTDSTQQAAATAVSSVVAAEAARYQAAVFATTRAGGSLEQNLAAATALQVTTARVDVRATEVDARSDTLPAGFSYSAPTMLVLFVFINAVAGGATIIETRRLGMYQRARAGPVRPADIVAGETFTYVVVALVQSALIVAIGALVFGVSWGDPLAAFVLVALWGFVGAGAGMLSGTLFRTPEQASAVGPAVGVAFGMLGGCMWPLSIVSPTMRQVGHFTPQAWAVDAWTGLVARGGTLTTIAPDLAVLAAFAAALMAVSTWRFRSLIA